jgi:hypothetical protein
VATSATFNVTDAIESIRSLPLWSQLSQLGNASKFEQDALLWLSLQPEFELIQQKFHPSADDLAAGYVGLRNGHRFAYRVAGLIGTMHPRYWHLCDLCNGSGRSHSLSKECDQCRGSGYEPAHRGDRVRRIDSTTGAAGTPPAEPAAKPQPEPATKPQPEPGANPQPMPAAEPQREPATNPQPEPAAMPQPAGRGKKRCFC